MSYKITSWFLHLNLSINCLHVNRCPSHWPCLLGRSLSIWLLCSNQVKKKTNKIYKLHLKNSAFIHHMFLFYFIRWCEQDLCPVVTNHVRGCYEPNTPPLDAAMVYDRPTWDWTLTENKFLWLCVCHFCAWLYLFGRTHLSTWAANQKMKLLPQWMCLKHLVGFMLLIITYVYNVSVFLAAVNMELMTNLWRPVMWISITWTHDETLDSL